jgi:DUF917 family protein
MLLRVEDIEPFAQGCAVLGTGGGGDTTIDALAAAASIERHGPVEVVSLDDLADDALVLPVAGWGAPTVGIEKFGSGQEGRALREAAERWFGRPVTALMAGEIGGGNGLLPLSLAAELRLPLVDADMMGRAFPEGDMTSIHVHGVAPGPAFFADERGNVVTALPRDAAWLERIARHLVIAFGGAVAGADHVMQAGLARDVTVRGSVPLALAIGRALAAEGIEGVLREAGGRPLIAGTVVDVERRTAEGFTTGVLTVEGTGAHAGRTVTIDVQNENLRAAEGDRTLAVVPDLITIVDEATGSAIPTERVRFGQRVLVLGIPCAPVWRTPRGLEIAGPGRFGFPGPFVPVEGTR